MAPAGRTRARRPGCHGGQSMTSWRSILVPTLVLGLAACSTQRHEMAHDGHGGPERAVRYDSLGSYSYRITTGSPEAQRWFDQGIRLVYAFNPHEAQKAFQEAVG